MDCHSRYRTDAYHNIVPRFNERFILSLVNCQNSIVIDDEFNILPITHTMDTISVDDIK